ncbi:MAG: HIT family protein [Lachnospiraceae bacterium]|nr:HIT family protein [Lachnospiraceae bacterium]
MKQDNCIFCKIIAGEIPSQTIYEDDKFKVILDVAPATKGHALILPKSHYANLYELPEDMAADTVKLAKKMMRVMTDRLSCDGFNILQNNGEIAGQSVFHFHMHLLPRYKDDGEILKYIPRNPDPKELEQIRKTITD